MNTFFTEHLWATSSTKAESELNKDLPNNFQTGNSCHRDQLEAEIKSGVAYKKMCII